MRRYLWAAAPVLLAAAGGDYLSARGKIAAIQEERVPPGGEVRLSEREVNEYVRAEIPNVVPEGVRNARVTLAKDRASGYALVDFVKLRRARGRETGWLLRQLIDGERAVHVRARIVSGGGQATVFVERVELDGMEISGATLDFLVDAFLLPLYPEAKIGRPFELSHNVERLDVRPNEVRVRIASTGAARASSGF